MATPAFADIDMPRIPPVRLAERRTQAALVSGNQDQLHVIGHQAGGSHLRARLDAPFRQQGDIAAIVVVANEHRQPPIAPLGHVMCDSRNHQSRQPRHVRCIGCLRGNRN